MPDSQVVAIFIVPVVLDFFTGGAKLLFQRRQVLQLVTKLDSLLPKMRAALHFFGPQIL